MKCSKVFELEQAILYEVFMSKNGGRVTSAPRPLRSFSCQCRFIFYIFHATFIVCKETFISRIVRLVFRWQPIRCPGRLICSIRSLISSSCRRMKASPGQEVACKMSWALSSCVGQCRVRPGDNKSALERKASCRRPPGRWWAVEASC